MFYNSDVYYIAKSERDAIINIIKNHSSMETSYSYDNALDEAHGFAKEHNYTVVHDVNDLIDCINDFIFINEIPKTVNVEELEKFHDELGKFYDNM